jgi:hypothetical protein
MRPPAPRPALAPRAPAPPGLSGARPPRRARPLALTFALSAALGAAAGGGACGGACGGVPEEARAGGDHPFVRCAALPPGPERAWRVGSLSLRRTGRVLHVEGGPPALDVGVAAGPAPGEGVDAAALARAREAGVRVLVVLGGLGDAPDAARRTARDLAGLGVPVLVLAGGRDEPTALAAALTDDALDQAARDRLVDLSPLHLVRLGPVDLVPLAGAPGGRYARTPDSCGFAAADVDARAAPAAARAGAPRILASWTLPSPAPALAGTDAGDPLVASLAARVGAALVVGAWPSEVITSTVSLPGAALVAADPAVTVERTAAARAAGEVGARPVLAVPRIDGPAHERADGVRAPAGVTVLRVEASGVRVLPAR